MNFVSHGCLDVKLYWYICQSRHTEHFIKDERIQTVFKAQWYRLMFDFGTWRGIWTQKQLWCQTDKERHKGEAKQAVNCNPKIYHHSKANFPLLSFYSLSQLKWTGLISFLNKKVLVTYLKWVLMRSWWKRSLVYLIYLIKHNIRFYCVTALQMCPLSRRYKMQSPNHSQQPSLFRELWYLAPWMECAHINSVCSGC